MRPASLFLFTEMVFDIGQIISHFWASVYESISSACKIKWIFFFFPVFMLKLLPSVPDLSKILVFL